MVQRRVGGAPVGRGEEVRPDFQTNGHGPPPRASWQGRTAERSAAAGSREAWPLMRRVKVKVAITYADIADGRRVRPGILA